MNQSDSLLVAAIEQQEDQAELYGNLGEDRIKALDYYLGEPLGNEVEGRSQVVSRDVFDTIEWIKPDLAEIFCGGDEVVAFSPQGPSDVQAAQQETDYVNHVVTQRNNWFEIFYAWSHDAILQKNGYVKAYWDDAEDRTREKYENLLDEEFQVLIMDQDVEVIEHSEEVLFVGPMPVRRHTVTVERIKRPETVRLVPIAPECVRVSQSARGLSLQDPALPFVEHDEWKTITQLRDEGFDVEDTIADSGSDPGDYETDLRDKYNPFRNRDEMDENDPSMRRVKVREVWIRFDWDGDGRAELRHVIIVGTTILLNEDADIVPIAALCPSPLPHVHYGLSLSDAVADLQRIKTALLRGALDNQYLATNGRYGVHEDNVNLDDMLDSRPGGVVRFKGNAAEAFFPLTHPTNGTVAIPMMEYVDNIIAKRTGVNEQTQGLDSSTINKNTPYATTAALMTAAQKRVKFIARIMAETGVKSLFQIVHTLTLKHSRKEQVVELREQWVTVDPRTWVKRNDMRISVGLGAGDKAQQLGFLEKLFQLQGAVAPHKLASPQNVYNTLVRFTRAAGYKDAKEFWTDPSQVPPQPNPPPPEIIVEQMRQQGAQALQDKKAQQAVAEAQMAAQVQRANKQDELAVQAQNDERDAQRQLLHAQLEQQAEQTRQQFEAMSERMALMQQRYEADLDARVRLTIAGMKAETDAIDAQMRANGQAPNNY